MKILFIVQVREGEVKETFVNQNQFLTEKDPGITYVTSDEELNDAIEAIQGVVPEDGFTHVVVFPANSKLNPTIFELIETYYKDQESVLMPIIELEREGVFKGFLNSCVWKPYFTETYGELDFKLALQQIDITLYGCIIPTKLLQENPLKPEIKYYSHNELINNLVSKEVSFIGCPKVFSVCDFNYELKDIPNEEKKKYFLAAREKYQNTTTPIEA